MCRRLVLPLLLVFSLSLAIADVRVSDAPGGQQESALWGGQGVPAPSQASSATSDALARASAALTALLQLAQSETMPTSAEVQAVLDQFDQALALDSTIAPGNFGWALTRFLLLVVDFEERFGEALVPSGEQGVTPRSLFSWRPLLDAAYMKKVLSPCGASGLGTGLLKQGQLPIGHVDEIQSYLISTALPALEAIKDHLDKAALDTAHIPFSVRNGTGTVIFVIDRGDLHLAKGAASLATAMVYMAVVYHLEPGSFDPVAKLGCCSTIYADGVVTRQEYLPASPFMTRYSQNHWSAMLASLGEAVTAVQAGVITSNHSGGPLDPINPNDPETAQDFAEWSQNAALFQLALAGPVAVPVSTPTGQVLVRVDITAWNTRLPSDLKTLFPTFNANWQIVSLPDRTFAGLFPDGDYPLTELGQDLVGLLESLFGVPLGESGPEGAPPWVSLWWPWNGAIVRGTVQVQGYASDDHCLQQVRIYVDGVAVATLPGCLSSLDLEWAWNTTSLADGPHQLRVAATDRASPTNTTSTTVNVTVDNTPPTVTLTSPTAGSCLRGVVRLSATASDSVGLQWVEFRAGTRLLYTDSTVPYQFDWDTRTFADGPTTLVARAMDWAGGTRDSTANVNVDNLLFDDVPLTSPYLRYITAVFNAGIAGGCYYNSQTCERRFCPGATITRAQMAVFLCRAAGKTWLNRDVPTFCDVPKTHWAYGYIERLVDTASWPGGVAITTGCGCGPGQATGCKCYCPDGSITRDQMAVFLCRAAGKAPLNRAVPTFADVPRTHWAYVYIERLADAPSWPAGAPTSGCAADNPATPENEARYCPALAVTRASMAVFLCRAFNVPLP